MKKKLTRTKQFNKYGKRRELTSIILSAGCITNYDFYLLGDKIKTYDTYVRRMLDEGFLREIKIKDTHKTFRIFALANYLDDKNMLLKFYEKYTLDYYDQKVDYYKNTLEEYAGRQKLLRNVRRSHVIALMSKTYIRVLTEDIDKLSILEGSEKISPYDAVFFPLEDIKTNLSAVSSSRAVGLLMTPSESYTVYDLMKARLGWTDSVEENVKGLVFQADKKFRNETFEIKDDSNAIVISEVKPVADMLIEKDRSKAKNRLNLIELPINSFKKVYWVPAYEDGIQMMQILSEENWEKELLKKLKSHYDPTQPTWIIHHATQGENTYVYFFCLSDLNEFKKFLVQTADYLDELKFKVVCFPFQRALLDEVLDARFEIVEITLDEIK